MPIRTIAATILARYRLDPGGIHGPAHWTRVAAIGRRLAAATAGADAGVVAYFALLHDCRRLGEGRDTGHGVRAADYALSNAGVIDLDAGQLDLLRRACRDHDRGFVTDDPTIGCCWDADRLDLSRLGIRPDPRRLSTDAARDPLLQAWAWTRGMRGEPDAEVAAEWGLAPPVTVAA